MGQLRDNERRTGGSPSSWPICATAFRWAADHDDLDTAAAIAVYATFLLGYRVQEYEASTRAEDLLEPAMANGHRRLAQLYTMAAVCYMTGRIQDFLNYADAGQSH